MSLRYALLGAAALLAAAGTADAETAPPRPIGETAPAGGVGAAASASAAASAFSNNYFIPFGDIVGTLISGFRGSSSAETCAAAYGVVTTGRWFQEDSASELMTQPNPNMFISTTVQLMGLAERQASLPGYQGRAFTPEGSASGAAEVVATATGLTLATQGLLARASQLVFQENKLVSQLATTTDRAARRQINEQLDQVRGQLRQVMPGLESALEAQRARATCGNIALPTQPAAVAPRVVTRTEVPADRPPVVEAPRVETSAPAAVRPDAPCGYVYVNGRLVSATRTAASSNAPVGQCVAGS